MDSKDVERCFMSGSGVHTDTQDVDSPFGSPSMYIMDPLLNEKSIFEGKSKSSHDLCIFEDLISKAKGCRLSTLCQTHICIVLHHPKINQHCNVSKYYFPFVMFI
jgi:hypothetical protein